MTQDGSRRRFASFLDSLRLACDAEPEWPQKIKAAIGAALDFTGAEPDLARLIFLDPLEVDVQVADRLLASSDRLASLLSAGRRHCPGAAGLPRLTEKTLISGVQALIGAHLAARGPERLGELEPQLVEIILRPYIGGEEAARVARVEA